MNYYYSCPNCGHDDDFVRVQDGVLGMGCLMLVFGGIIPYLLFSTLRSGRVQCANCLRVFRPPAPPSTGVSHLAVIIIAILVFFIMLMAMIFTIPVSDKDMPQAQFLLPLEKAIQQHAYAIALAMPILLVLIILICVVSSAVSNHRLRQRIRQEFLTRPTSVARRAGSSSTQKSDSPP